jgi:hypothetical protein
MILVLISVLLLVKVAGNVLLSLAMYCFSSLEMYYYCWQHTTNIRLLCTTINSNVLLLIAGNVLLLLATYCYSLVMYGTTICSYCFNNVTIMCNLTINFRNIEAKLFLMKRYFINLVECRVMCCSEGRFAGRTFCIWGCFVAKYIL